MLLNVLFVFGVAQASETSSLIPYYGESFYRDLQAGVKDQLLQVSLKTVLRSYHVSRPGSLDLVTQTCLLDQQTCYRQSSLSYYEARKFLLGGFYLTQDIQGEYQVKDVYCDSVRTRREFRRGFPAPGFVPDDRVVNVEHTWPQSRFSKKFSEDFQKTDLHHLFPTDSKINRIRGNSLFGEVSTDVVPLRCTKARFGYGTAGDEEVFEPPQNHKGNVARALFYFSIRYDLPIDDREEVILKKWNAEDPIDSAELNRNEEIFKIQGNRNPFIDFPNLAEDIADF